MVAEGELVRYLERFTVVRGWGGGIATEQNDMGTNTNKNRKEKKNNNFTKNKKVAKHFACVGKIPVRIKRCLTGPKKKETKKVKGFTWGNGSQGQGYFNYLSKDIEGERANCFEREGKSDGNHYEE